ncbi:MAG: hypothetical protein RIB86_13150 [Imperialibacter sp.]
MNSQSYNGGRQSRVATSGTLAAEESKPHCNFYVLRLDVGAIQKRGLLYNPGRTKLIIDILGGV